MNPIETAVSNVITGVVLDIAIKKTIEAMILKAPWLALPVINPVFQFIVKTIVMQLFDKLDIFAYYKVVDINVGHQAKEYGKAIEELKKLQGSTDEIAKQAALAEVRKRLDDLVRLHPPK